MIFDSIKTSYEDNDLLNYLSLSCDHVKVKLTQIFMLLLCLYFDLAWHTDFDHLSKEDEFDSWIFLAQVCYKHKPHHDGSLLVVPIIILLILHILGLALYIHSALKEFTWKKEWKTSPWDYYPFTIEIDSNV